MNIKVTHYGQDYAKLQIGGMEFEVPIPLAKAIERAENQVVQLDPTKKYLMVFDQHTIRKADVASLAQMLAAEGIVGLMVVLNGDPSTVKIVETEGGEV